jgi:hypothetical protein
MAASKKPEFGKNEHSPFPAKSLADICINKEAYSADLELATRSQNFTKELVRISLLGLGAYGFLLKAATGEHGSMHIVGEALLNHYLITLIGIAGFGFCAGSALFHGYLEVKCMHYQLTILRYFGRLEGDRWHETEKDLFRKVIEEKQKSQRFLLGIARIILRVATISLIAGAFSVVVCSALVLFNQISSHPALPH